jgi:hypothetical protein
MSPEVWADAEALIRDGATQIGLPVAWPNQRFADPEPPAPFLAVEGMGDGAEPYELGGGIWIEDGAVVLHILVPVGTGVARGPGAPQGRRRLVPRLAAATRRLRQLRTGSGWDG